MSMYIRAEEAFYRDIRTFKDLLQFRVKNDQNCHVDKG